MVLSLASNSPPWVDTPQDTTEICKGHSGKPSSRSEPHWCFSLEGTVYSFFSSIKSLITQTGRTPLSLRKLFKRTEAMSFSYHSSHSPFHDCPPIACDIKLHCPRLKRITYTLSSCVFPSSQNSDIYSSWSSSDQSTISLLGHTVYIKTQLSGDRRQTVIWELKSEPSG